MKEVVKMAMRICEVNFGGEIGTRPAVILRNQNNNLEVMKITTKAKLNDYGKYRLSGYSGVRGYVVTNTVYVVPKARVKRYTNKLFDYESKAVFQQMNSYDRQGKLDRKIIG